MKRLMFFILASCLCVMAGAMSREESASAENETKTETADKKKVAINVSDETMANVSFIGQLFSLVQQLYVESPDAEKMVTGAVNGMVSALDPHSAYFNEEQFAKFAEDSLGQTQGVGMQITMEKGLLKVIAPIEDSPAHKAGIKAGDYIYKVDNKPLVGLSLEEAVAKIKRGKLGSKVKLAIIRDGQTLNKEVKRQKIKLKSVKYGIINNVGYVRIIFFNEDTDKGFREAVAYFKKKLKTPEGIVLDVRSNPGGTLDAATAVCNHLLKEGVSVTAKGRQEEQNQTFKVKSTGLATTYPLVVLVDGGTASAPEIVAGAVQDHKRGIVMGKTTFGKATVQRLVEIPGKGALKLTIARYYTPKGHHIQGVGIKPDIEVDQLKFEKLEDVNSIREKDLDNTLAAQVAEEKKKEAPKVFSDKGTYSEDILKAYVKDYQLTRAVELVKSIHILNNKNNDNTQQTTKHVSKKKS